MTRNKTLLMVIGVIFFSLFFFTEGNTKEKNDRWIYYGKTMSGDFYYNNSSIVNVSPQISKVWFKIKLSKLEKDNTLQQFRKFGQSMDYWEKLDNQIMLYELDCVNKTGKTLKLVYYDIKGKTLLNHDYSDPTTDQIIPGSMNDILLNKVCPNK